MATSPVRPHVGYCPDLGSSPLARIRIVLGAMPSMLREIICEVFSGQPDMSIVSEPSSDNDLATAISEFRADLVILELVNDSLSRTGERLLRSHPRLKSLGISRDGRTAAIYQMIPARTQVGEVSPEGLRGAVRQAISATPG